MGRHATPAAPLEPQDPATDRSPGLLERHVPRLVLAATGGVTTTFAVAWAGNAWSSAAIAGAAVGAVVLGAAWLASTVPAPPDPDAEPDLGARSGPTAPSVGREPVQ